MEKGGKRGQMGWEVHWGGGVESQVSSNLTCVCASRIGWGSTAGKDLSDDWYGEKEGVGAY